MDKMQRMFLGGVIVGLLLGLSDAFAFQAHRSAVGSRLLHCPPGLEQSAFSAGHSILVEVSVDPRGRVQDYRVLANAKSDLTPQMKNMLIFTTFRPATFMGKPVAGTAVLALPN
jgi:hypothetical protein